MKSRQHKVKRRAAQITLVVLAALLATLLTFAPRVSADNSPSASASEINDHLQTLGDVYGDVYIEIAAQRSPTQTPDHGLPEEAFNYEMATATVKELETSIREANAEIQALVGNVDLLRHELDFLMLNDEARAELLVESRNTARSMAIRTYIGIGAPVSSITLLNTENANQMSYRNGLLRQQTEHLYIVADTYAQLLADLDDQQKSKSDEINEARRKIESLRTHIMFAQNSLEDAQHWLYIADIHRIADESFAKSRRVEPTGEQWRKLRFCEATERYDVDSGNSFYGAYQFTWETWETVYGSGNPAHATPEEQDARARVLYARRGSQPWPICGRFLP